MAFIFFRSRQAARHSSNATSGPVSPRKCVVKEYDAPSPQKLVNPSKTRRDFAKSDDETIPLCSPASVKTHLKQH